MPKVSVLLPTYNNETTLGAAIDSILGQTFADFELLVIDDASSDGTPALLAKYTDPRLRIIRNETNLKIVAALNSGLDQAKGDYIARMDADDISLPKRFALQCAYLDSHPPIGVVGSWIEIFGTQRVSYIHRCPATHDEIIAASFFVNPMAHPTVMMRRSALAGAHYATDYPYAEDWELWCRLMETLRFANMQEVLVRYRIKPSVGTPAVSHSQSGKERLLRTNITRLGLSPDNLAVHMLITDHAVTDAQGLRAIEAYLSDVVAGNKVAMRYPLRTFEQEVGRQWFMCSRAAWSSNLACWYVFKKSPLRAFGGYGLGEVTLLAVRIQVWRARGWLRAKLKRYGFLKK
jgi:glycosyltransferase involved in cell wall biosynthesis